MELRPVGGVPRALKKKEGGIKDRGGHQSYGKKGGRTLGCQIPKQAGRITQNLNREKKGTMFQLCETPKVGRSLTERSRIWVAKFSGKKRASKKRLGGGRLRAVIKGGNQQED